MGTLSKLRRLVLREGVSVLKQVIKVGDSGAQALRLRVQRVVEQSR